MPVKYQEIASRLRDDIESGAWAVGDQLPTEADLMQEHGSSRTTVRQALQALRDEGLVRMRHGVGVFVAPPAVVQRLDSRERLSKARRERNQAAFLAEAAEQRFTPSSSVRIWFEPANEHAEALDIAEDAEVCVRDRMMRADGQPVMLAVSRLPRDITRGTVLEEAETGSGGAFARLAELGYEQTHHEEIVGVKVADAHERQILDLGKSPLLTVRRITWSGQRVVEINDMKMPGDSYELRYSWDAN